MIVVNLVLLVGRAIAVRGLCVAECARDDLDPRVDQTVGLRRHNARDGGGERALRAVLADAQPHARLTVLVLL